MNDLEFTFGEDTLRNVLSGLKAGEPVSAAQLLTALDGEEENTLEDVFDALTENGIQLDVTTLPRYSADTELSLRLRREEQLVKNNSLLQGLEENDPLRLYLEEIDLIPACGDSSLLAEELKNKRTEEAKTKLLNLSLSRVVELACDFTGMGVLLTDLIQEGSMGLWQALESYFEGDFETYRDAAITQSLTKAVILQAHASGVGQKLRQAVEDYRSVDEKLLAELGRNPTTEEIAAALHVSVEEATVVAQALESARLIARAKKPEPERLPQEEDLAVEDTAYFQMRQRIDELLSVLSPEDAKLLTLRYGLEGGQPLTTIQVAAKLGTTPEEVTKREAAALSQLRQQ